MCLAVVLLDFWRDRCTTDGGLILMRRGGYPESAEESPSGQIATPANALLLLQSSSPGNI